MKGGDLGHDGVLAVGRGFVGVVGRGRKTAAEVGVGVRGEAVGEVAGVDLEVRHPWHMGLRLVSFKG